MIEKLTSNEVNRLLQSTQILRGKRDLHSFLPTLKPKFAPLIEFLFLKNIVYFGNLPLI